MTETAAGTERHTTETLQGGAAVSATEQPLMVPVVRDPRFQYYSPERFSIIRTSSESVERYEVRLQSLVHRELSQRLNLVPGGGLGVVGREVRLEVVEFAAVSLTTQQMAKLRDDMSRVIAAAGPRSEDTARARLAQLGAQIDVAEAELSRQTRHLRDRRPPRETSELALLSDRIVALTEELASRPPEPAQVPATRPAPAAPSVFDPPVQPLVPLLPERRSRGLGNVLGVVIAAGMAGSLAWALKPAVVASPAPPRPVATAGAAPNASSAPVSPLVSHEVPAVAPAAPPAAERPAPVAPQPAADAALAVAAPTSTAEAQAPAPMPAPVATAPVSAPVPVEPPVDPAPPAAPPPPHLLIHVRANTWLRVRDPRGKLYVDRTLAAGETWTVPQVAGLLMTTGNAGSTFLVVDGVTQGPLGSEGTVVSERLAR